MTEKPIETVKMPVSVFKPLVIVIGDKEFPVRDVRRGDQKKIEEFDDMIRAGDLDAQYARLEWLLDLKKPDPAIDELTTREVTDLTNQLIEKLYAADESDMRFSGDTKNARGRGRPKSA